MKRIIRSFSRPDSVVEPLQSKDSRTRCSFGNLFSKTRPASAPEVFVQQFPHRTIEQLKEQSALQSTLSPPMPIQHQPNLLLHQEQHPEQQQEQQPQTNRNQQGRIHLRDDNTMEIENSFLPTVPPRTRLNELKTSAEFAAEDFNHTIKTWVNMASLLVKQVRHQSVLFLGSVICDPWMGPWNR